MEFGGDFLESGLVERGGQGSGASARNAMDHPPARERVAALLHLVSQRDSLFSFGGGTRSWAWSKSWQSSDHWPLSASWSRMEIVERCEWCSLGDSDEPGSGLAAWRMRAGRYMAIRQ